MMATTMVPDEVRWQSAARRAVKNYVRILQVIGSGQWIATSGKEPDTAYGLEVTGNVCHGCECQAAAHGDGICQHRAAFYLHIGALQLAESVPPPEAAIPNKLEPFMEQARAMGTAEEDTVYVAGHLYEIAHRCQSCLGCGIADAGAPCHDCHGSGYVPGYEELA